MKTKILFVIAIALLFNSCKKEVKDDIEIPDSSTFSIKDKLKDVLGGSQISIANAPYQVAVFRNDGRAGGVILGESWILTAAHVVSDAQNQQIPANQLTIRVGSTDVNSGSARGVARVIRHPNYTGVANNDGTVNNDIALIQLSSPLDFNINIRPVNYDKNNTSVAINDLAVVSGWGLIAYNANANTGTLPTDLYEASVRISAIEPNLLFTSSTTSSQQAPCFGDSGGPLTIGSGYYGKLLVGIVNGWGDCNTGAKGYARVSAYANWIFAETGITGIPAPPQPSISGPTSVSRGVRYLFKLENYSISSGDVLTWIISSSTGKISSGQGTRFATVSINPIGGSGGDSISLEIVDANGGSKILDHGFNIRRASDGKGGGGK